MARHLASIRTISDLQPIEGKDRIVLATVDGWKVIVRKDDYTVGQKCVYVEPDAVLPDKPEFEFLRSKQFHIKTMKMAGVISQGICFPLDILPSPANHYKVGDDVTEELSIKHCEEDVDDGAGLEATTKQQSQLRIDKYLMRFSWYRKLKKLLHAETTKGFPKFISKSDEIRIQNCHWVLANNNKWVSTEKIDGCSLTAVLVRHKHLIPLLPDKYEFILCSRNRRLSYKPDDTHYWRAAIMYDLPNRMKKIIGNNSWVAIQGEVIGPKIQGNKYKVKDVDLYVFNLIYPSGRKPSLEAKDTVNSIGLKHVPIVASDITLPDTVDEVLKMAHGQSEIGDTLREGLVFRSMDGQQSFKAVDPEFLLKYNA